MPAYPIKRSRLIAKIAQIRISSRSFTGYGLATRGNAATSASTAPKPSARAIMGVAMSPEGTPEQSLGPEEQHRTITT